MIETCHMCFPVFTTELRGHVFLCLILDAKIPTFAQFNFEKSCQQVKERWTLTCIKQVIPKPSYTVVLCYLTPNTFNVGIFSERNLILVKMIILNDFL